MSDTESKQPQRVEVITCVKRRRRWSVAEKIRIVQECEQPGMSVSYVTRKYDIAPNLLFRWRKLMREGGLSAIQANELVIGASEVKRLKHRIRELERLLGKKTMEAEILKEAIEIAREKRLISRVPCRPKKIPCKGSQ
jgi:transposase